MGEQCEHENTATHYDCVTCRDCYAVHTDSGWGIARNQWFRNREEAEFFKKNGRLPQREGGG